MKHRMLVATFLCVMGQTWAQSLTGKAPWNNHAWTVSVATVPLLNETVEQMKNLPDSADRLMTDFTNVRITIDTELTNYNGRALGKKEARYFGVKIGESIRVRATGSRTKVGSSKNTYKIDWGGANPDNYNVSEDLGTLTVRSIYTEPEKQAKDEPDSKKEESKPAPEPENSLIRQSQREARRMRERAQTR